MKKILFIGILAVTQSSFAAKAQEVSIKPDTSVVILDVRGDDCRFHDFNVQFDTEQDSNGAQRRAALNEVKLSMTEGQDEVQKVADLIQSRIEASMPACSEAVKLAARRPDPLMCFRPRKQISIFLDESLKFHNEKVVTLEAGKFLLTTADGVTVKVLQVKKN